jgi:hypothetical protein
LLTGSTAFNYVVGLGHCGGRAALGGNARPFAWASAFVAT